MAEVIDIGATGGYSELAGYGIMDAAGTTVPSNEAVGYGHGCTYHKANGSDGSDALYVNIGTKASANFVSRSSFDTISETTAGAGVTIDGVLVKDTGIFNADLTLSSTNEINIQIGAISLLAIDDAAISGNVAAAADGKSVFIETQDGAIAGAVGVAGYDGADFTLTAGVGGTANDPESYLTGESGCISLVTQAQESGGAAGPGPAGVIRLITAGLGGTFGMGAIFKTQSAPVAYTTNTAATLLAADLLTGLVTVAHTTGGTATYTLPLGTLLDAAIHSQVGVDEAFEWVLINNSLAAVDTVTVAADTGHTIVGATLIPSGHVTTGGLDGTNSARFRTRRTAADTFVTYRV